MSDPTCSIEGCENKRITRGWCKKHYTRWQRHGDPTQARVAVRASRPPRPAPERFWEKVDFSGDCWLWMAGRQSGGYGSFWDAESVVKAHRYSYSLLVGTIPEGLTLDHLCRVRHCVNPDHLEPVTHVVNVQRGFGMNRRNVEKTHCKRGHEFTLENTLPNGKSGWRKCRTCARASAAARCSKRAAA